MKNATARDLDRNHSKAIFFFNDTATTEIYTLSLHDALPIFLHRPGWALPTGFPVDSHIRLEALDAKTSAALAKTFLGQAASEQTIAFVVERAEGNPLYLVELCGAVSE